MSDSKMIALITETMKNYESMLITKLEMAGRFSAMCASKTRMDESETDKSVNDVYFRGIALGIMKYNSIVNDLIFLRIIKEFMSEFKIDKTHKSSKTRKSGNKIKFNGRVTIRGTKRGSKNKSSKIRSRTSIGGASLRPITPNIQSAAESGHGKFGIQTSRSRSLDRSGTGTRRNRSMSPGRRSMTPGRSKISNAIPTETRNIWGISKKYSSILFAIVIFLLALASAYFQSTQGISDIPSYKTPDTWSPDEPAVLNIHFNGEAIENAGRWVSGKDNCGVFSLRDRTQEELDGSVRTYQGINPEDKCIGKSSLKAQSDAFKSGIMPYANSLIMKQKDICNVIFKSGFSYHNIDKSTIWDSGKISRIPGIEDIKIGTQWQADIISNLCDTVGIFGFENISGQDKLTIKMPSPRIQNHYLSVFTQQLNELKHTGYITTQDKDELLKVINVLRDFPDLSKMTYKSISSGVISDDLLLGDKINGISQILIDYNSNVKRWRETHAAMLSDTGLKEGYHLEKSYLSGKLNIEMHKKISDNEFIWWKEGIEHYLIPLKAIIPAVTDSIVTVFTNVAGGVFIGIGDLGQSLFTMIKTLTSIGFIPATTLSILLMIFKDTTRDVVLRFLTAVFERLNIGAIRRILHR